MWMKRLPKVELHCHLDGSIPVPVLQQLCLSGQIAIPSGDADFRKLVEVTADCQSLTEFLKAFELPLQCLKTEDAFFTAAYETAAKAAEEGTRYLELRFAPLLSDTEKLPAEQIVEAAIAGFQKATAEHGICGGLILCGMRHFGETENFRTLELAKRYLGRGVCGADIAGDESAFPNENFELYFRKALQQEIPLTVHSGECGRKKNIELAVQCGARRIGHGIAMRGDLKLQEDLAKRRIGVEMCPTSNLQTKAVQDWESYPFREFLRSGVAVTINTDNRTVSNTTMTEELQLLRDHFALTRQEAGQLMRQAMEVSFAEESTKSQILRELDQWETECQTEPERA